MVPTVERAAKKAHDFCVQPHHRTKSNMNKCIIFIILFLFQTHWFFSKDFWCNTHTKASCKDVCNRIWPIGGGYVKCCQGVGNRDVWTHYCKNSLCIRQLGK